MQMYEFFVLKGHSLDELARLSASEKILMHHAMETYITAFSGGDER